MNGTGKKDYPGQQAELMRCCPPQETITTSNTAKKSADDPTGATYFKCCSPDYSGC